MPTQRRIAHFCGIVFAAVILTGCSGGGGLTGIGESLFGGRTTELVEIPTPAGATAGTPPPVRGPVANARRGGFLGIGRNATPDGTRVNAFLWAAALDVLHFLPLVSVDPYSGIIETGYGTAPGASTAYRATVLVQQPALDATSLHLSVYTRAGRASAQTHADLAEAILTRARELRINSDR